jgi:hypothetical protein
MFYCVFGITDDEKVRKASTSECYTPPSEPFEISPLRISFSAALQTIQDPGLLFISVTIYSETVELLGRVISPSQGRYLNTGEHKHRINAYTHQTSMP